MKQNNTQKFRKLSLKFTWFDIILICVTCIFILLLVLILIWVLRSLVIYDCYKMYYLTNNIPRMCVRI